MKHIALIALALAVVACSSDGPSRDPAELHKIENPKLKPHVRWDRSPGDGSGDVHASLRLAVEKDAVFTADVDGYVYAMGLADGKRLWRAETRARIVSGPSVSGNLVLVGTQDAEVIALKRADGTQLWRVTVSSEVVAPPAGSGEIVVARCGDGKIFGLAASNGARKWSFDRAVPPLTLRGASDLLIDGNMVYAGLDNGRAVALNLATGELKWEQVVSAPAGRTELERIVDVDAELVTTGDGMYAVSFGGELAAVGLDEGRVAWRRPVKSYSGIAMIDKQLFVTDEDGVVWALDADTGASLWKQDGLKYRRLSAPVVQRGYLVVGDLDGILHWLSPKDGKIVARISAVDDAVTAPPVVKDEIVYVMDIGGEVAAVEAAPL